MNKKLKTLVEEVLSSEPESRNSDITLAIRIWQRFYGVGSEIALESLHTLPAMTSITRWRAELNSQGKYLPTDWAVARRRGINELEWKRALGYHVQNDGQYSILI